MVQGDREFVRLFPYPGEEKPMSHRAGESRAQWLEADAPGQRLQLCRPACEVPDTDRALKPSA
jgi:hypothetical protein